MKTIEVKLGERSYPIHIGKDLLGNTQYYAPHINGKNAVVITSESVASLYLETVESALKPLAEVATCVLPDGETLKTLRTVESIFNDMIAVPCGRNTTIVALGGGVVGDIAGFAAACYQRGVPFIQVPTTVVAQVDSSVGGKTGVNLERGKNMVGAFYQPRCVIADTDTLNTLPAREVRAGVAEIIKYGAIRDAALFEWLEGHVEDLINLEADCVSHAVIRSCINKAEIVAQDERESGVRAILNFGHTFGHAIETATGYSEWLHGEAVATGMVMASDFSNRMGLLTPSGLVRIRSLVQRAGLPQKLSAPYSPEQFIELMRADKKTVDGNIRLIAIEEIGKAVIVDKNQMGILLQTLKANLSVATAP